MTADITYRELQRDVTNLGKQVMRASEAIRGHAQTITDEACDTARVAEAIATLGVDQETVAETSALARLMDSLSDAAIGYASKADTTAKAAQAAHDQNQTSHGGIAEAVSRSSVDVSNLNREWLRQE